MRRATVMALSAAAWILAGCGDHEFEPPARGDRVARAETGFSPAMFDSVGWEGESAQLTEGNTIYAETCRRCHGPLGQGATDYARERNLAIPSLVVREWRYAQVDSLRRKIFVGHESGMPVFGDGGLTPRQIDATAAYILRVLRPDVLEQD